MALLVEGDEGLTASRLLALIGPASPSCRPPLPRTGHDRLADAPQTVPTRSGVVLSLEGPRGGGIAAATPPSCVRPHHTVRASRGWRHLRHVLQARRSLAQVTNEPVPRRRLELRRAAFRRQMNELERPGATASGARGPRPQPATGFELSDDHQLVVQLPAILERRPPSWGEELDRRLRGLSCRPVLIRLTGIQNAANGHAVARATIVSSIPDVPENVKTANTI